MEGGEAGMDHSGQGVARGPVRAGAAGPDERGPVAEGKGALPVARPGICSTRVQRKEASAFASLFGSAREEQGNRLPCRDCHLDACESGLSVLIGVPDNADARYFREPGHVPERLEETPKLPHAAITLDLNACEV